MAKKPKMKLTEARKKAARRRGLLKGKSAIRAEDTPETVRQSARQEENLVALDDYVRGLTHEILGPLNVIMGHLDYLYHNLEKESIPLERKRLKLQDALIEGDLLSMLVNRLGVEQTPKSEYWFEECDFFSDVLRVVATMRKYFAARRGLTIRHYETLGSIPEMIVDRQKMTLVFSNLLLNAIKYSDRYRAIDVKTSVEGNWVRFDVSNYGLAIREGEEKKIFRKFFRGIEADHYVPVGIGLGLYICQLVVENHDGRIFVSKLKNPTTISVKIPLHGPQ